MKPDKGKSLCHAVLQAKYEIYEDLILCGNLTTKGELVS
jgi:hypothetical protein